MCNIPKNPHLNPKPKAADDSGSKTSDESFNWAFPLNSATPHNPLYPQDISPQTP